MGAAREHGGSGMVAPGAPQGPAQPCSHFRAQVGAVEMVSDLEGQGTGPRQADTWALPARSERCRPSSERRGVRGTVR